jgi:hypothetical protein
MGHAQTHHLRTLQLLCFLTTTTRHHSRLAARRARAEMAQRLTAMLRVLCDGEKTIHPGLLLARNHKENNPSGALLLAALQNQEQGTKTAAARDKQWTTGCPGKEKKGGWEPNRRPSHTANQRAARQNLAADIGARGHRVCARCSRRLAL